MIHAPVQTQWLKIGWVMHQPRMTKGSPLRRVSKFLTLSQKSPASLGVSLFTRQHCLLFPVPVLWSHQQLRVLVLAFVQYTRALHLILLSIVTLWYLIPMHYISCSLLLAVTTFRIDPNELNFYHS